MYSMFSFECVIARALIESGHFLQTSLLIAMKKEVVLSVRVDSDIDDILRALAKKEDRTVAWILRKLIIEALEARKLIRPKAKPAR